MTTRCFANFGGCLSGCFQRGLCIAGGWGPSRMPPNADGVVGEALSEIIVGPSFLAKLANAGPRWTRLPNWLILGSYVLLQE